jgi:hypothetical protein
MARLAGKYRKHQITVKYVIHALVKDYEEKGWVVVSRFPRAPHHAQYSVIMERVLPRWFQYLPRSWRLLYLRLYNVSSQY